MTILDMLEQDGIEMRRVASTNGGEYAGPCPKCGGKDRFRCFPEQGDGGSWWCRGCDKGGDCIQYLRDMRELSFKEACSFLGRDPGTSSNLDRKEKKPTWEPKENISPNEIWQKKSSALVAWCHNQLLSDSGKNALEYLKTERGLSEEAIKTFRLGWNPKDAWPGRKAWGLPEGVNKEGKPTTKIYLPKGIVIPCFVDELLAKVKIRLQEPKEKDPQYLPVPGGYVGPHILGNNHKIFVIVESELCGILLHQQIGNLAGVIVLGSAFIRPDKKIIDILQRAELLLIGLDSEPHKEINTGAKQSWNFWLKYFPKAKRWPPIDGKDPGEMWENGVNLRMWIEAGIDQYLIKPEPKPAITEKFINPKSATTGPSVTDNLDQDFIKANLIIKLHSDLAGEDFYLCSTPELKDEAKANDPDTVAYLPHEIRKLSGLKPDEVKKSHLLKKIFGGEFIARNKLEDSIFTRMQEEEGKNIGIYNPRLGLKTKIPTGAVTSAGTDVKEVE